MDRQETTQKAHYRNMGKTPEEINTVNAKNQKNSALLRLPTELLIIIWTMAIESEKATRVQGMVSRQACYHCVLSLVHSCSLLRNALYRTFLEQNTFIIKVSSSDPFKAADELKQWWKETTRGFIPSKPAKPLIFVESKVGCLPCTDAVRLAAEVQLICSVETQFQPKVLVELSGTAVSYYGGPGVLMWLYPPPVEGWYDMSTGGPHLNHLAPPLADRHDQWKGWVATTVSLDASDDRKGSGRARFLSEHEVLKVCRSDKAWWPFRGY
jgi:hypothetical protein